MMRIYMFFCLFLTFPVNALELAKTAACDGVSENKTEADLNAAKIIEAVYKRDNIDVTSSCLGWTNLGAGSAWFELVGDLKFNGIDIGTKQYIGSWKIDAPDNCQGSDDIDCVTHWWAGRWSDQEVLDQEYITRIREHGILIPFKAPVNEEELLTAAGCFSKNPLRYGDISDDGKTELVLFLKDDFIVFSPELKKTTFAFSFNVPDWISWDELLEQGLALSNDEDSPQFGSRKLFEELGSTSIGYRGYGKIYTGNFESAASKDLLIWRKFYQSRLKKDTVKGFEKIHDTYIHYKLINGEYKKQPTEQNVVKGWLAAKNLTWQKGYPSKSECPGKEGQLIPEMHDPLLNDPDVLK